MYSFLLETALISSKKQRNYKNEILNPLLMLQGITSSKDIVNAQSVLKEKLLEISDENYSIKYSSKGGLSNPVQASYSKKYDIWWFFSQKDTQFYNPYGKGSIHDGQAATGKCQINVPKKGYNASLGGAYAKDEYGNLVILHNGRVGGGKIGIGKKAFCKYYVGKSVPVNFDGRIGEYYIIAELTSSKFFEQLVFFINQVYSFKNQNDQSRNSESTGGYYDSRFESRESTRRKSYRIPERTVSPGADHAIITNALLEWLNNQGYKARRDNFIDTFIFSEKKITHIFEVKSKLNTQTLYTAIGQLFYYSLNSEASLIFVIEESIKPKLINDLSKLNIYCLTFRYKNNKPVFKELANLPCF